MFHVLYVLLFLSYSSFAGETEMIRFSNQKYLSPIHYFQLEQVEVKKLSEQRGWECSLVKDNKLFGSCIGGDASGSCRSTYHCQDACGEGYQLEVVFLYNQHENYKLVQIKIRSEK